MNLYGSLCDGMQLVRTAQQFLRQTAALRGGRDASPAAAGASMLCVTATDGSYPTVAGAVYVVTPQELDAEDTEGAVATATGDTTQNFYALNLGASIPPQGTQIVCHSVGGRWCFRWDG